MYYNIFTITLAVWISCTSAARVQEPMDIEPNRDVDEITKVESMNNVADALNDDFAHDVASDITVDQTKVSDEQDNINDAMGDVVLKRRAAKEFFQRDRRGLNHECYAECCRWEEVREHYEHDMPAAENYWNEYQNWRARGGRC